MGSPTSPLPHEDRTDGQNDGRRRRRTVHDLGIHGGSLLFRGRAAAARIAVHDAQATAHADISWRRHRSKRDELGLQLQRHVALRACMVYSFGQGRIVGDEEIIAVGVLVFELGRPIWKIV